MTPQELATLWTQKVRDASLGSGDTLRTYTSGRSFDWLKDHPLPQLPEPETTDKAKDQGSDEDSAKASSKKHKAKDWSQSTLALQEPCRFQVLDVQTKRPGGTTYGSLAQPFQRPCEVTVLTPRATENRSQALAEACISAGLAHPNIHASALIGQGPDGLTVVITPTEPKRSWLDALKARDPDKLPTTFREHLGILRQLCHAVEYAHSRGILHCDLKPENVRLGEHGEVLLSGWGMALDHPALVDAQAAEEPIAEANGAKRAFAKTSLHGPFGTPAYMAPELAHGQAEDIGPWSDIYLLGACLHEILTGVPPHHGPTLLKNILSAQKSKAPTFSKDIPAQLQAICRKAMAKDSSKRHDSARALARALDSALAHLDSDTLTRQASGILKALKGSGTSPLAMQLGAYSDAISCLEHALLLWPKNPVALKRLPGARLGDATVALKAGDFQRAESQIAKTPETPERSAALAELQRLRADKQRSQRATRLLKLVLLLLITGLGLAIVYTIRGQSQKQSRALSQGLDFANSAVQSGQAALEQEPDNRAELFKQSQLLCQRASLLAALHKWPEAEADFKKAIQYSTRLTQEQPQSASYLRLLAAAYGSLAELQNDQGQESQARQSLSLAQEVLGKLLQSSQAPQDLKQQSRLKALKDLWQKR